jgi:hypothetical protein
MRRFCVLHILIFLIIGSASCDKSPSLKDMVKIPAGSFVMGSSEDEIRKIIRDLGHGEFGLTYRI